MKEYRTDKSYKGILVIGDPHLESRIPGFRKDSYPQTVLQKLGWALELADREELLPLISGDLFHLPRNNPNWLLVEVMNLFWGREILGIYGNHDVHENKLSTDDSISVIARSGHLWLLDNNFLVRSSINGEEVLVGGSPWGEKLPGGLGNIKDADNKPGVIWLTHHDIIVPGYEEQGRLKPRELPGIDLVVNGHIHRCLEDVQKGGTLWLTPGNISRRSRSDATRAHKPAVLRIDPCKEGFDYSHIQIPHQDYEEVFYQAYGEEESETAGSSFVAGLAELQNRKTQTGEGLRAFLEKNLDQFDSDIAGEIRNLAREVIGDE